MKQSALITVVSGSGVYILGQPTGIFLHEAAIAFVFSGAIATALHSDDKTKNNLSFFIFATLSMVFAGLATGAARKTFGLSTELSIFASMFIGVASPFIFVPLNFWAPKYVHAFYSNILLIFKAVFKKILEIIRHFPHKTNEVLNVVNRIIKLILNFVPSILRFFKRK